MRPPKIRPDVHARFARVLARATERVAAEAAEIERRILALRNLDARQPAKKSRLMADAGVKLVISGEDARKRAWTTQAQSDSLPGSA